MKRRTKYRSAPRWRVYVRLADGRDMDFVVYSWTRDGAVAAAIIDMPPLVVLRAERAPIQK